jgi:hypothetical protein
MSPTPSPSWSTWASSPATPDTPRAHPARTIGGLARLSRLFAVTIGRAALIELGLRVTTLPRLASWLGVPLDTGRRGVPTPPEVTAARLTPSQQARVAAIGAVYRRWPFGDTCLRRALADGHTLRSRSPVLRVGVTRRDGAVLAHAWIEFDGMSLGSDPAAGYAALSTPP